MFLLPGFPLIAPARRAYRARGRHLGDQSQLVDQVKVHIVFVLREGKTYLKDVAFFVLRKIIAT